MERFNRVTEGSDPSTGLEEPMLHLGLGGGGGGGGGGMMETYPDRPDEPDCIYYLRTGFCGYGARCRFNHPHDRVAVLAVARATGGEYPERMGQPVCQYFMRTGSCKFGASCKYHHPRQGGGYANPVTLNYYGYPLRPGEKECTYYVKTGQCKFGATCKFHHPQPAGVQVQTPPHQIAPPPAPAPMYPTMQSLSVPNSQQYGVVMARPQIMQSSYVQGPYGPILLSPGMVPIPGWSPYPGPGSPVASPNTQHVVGSSSMYGMTQLSPSASPFAGAYQQQFPSPVDPSSSIQKEQPFPERPGQAECQFFMKTGDCKFGASCRYNHPSDHTMPKSNVLLSPIGLPLRPGSAPCSHYAQHGACKFGPACKFDHPMGTLNYSPSASSLADMPVAPYPVGSTIGTLAPSSSSSDMRRELISGFIKESASTKISSSIGIKIPVPPRSSEQQQSQSSGPSTASGTTSSEAHKSS
ncbi:hypothetical protein ACFE04_013860 [Oxalis oulophora]